jgi:hypothetical protein
MMGEVFEKINQISFLAKDLIFSLCLENNIPNWLGK